MTRRCPTWRPRVDRHVSRTALELIRFRVQQNWSASFTYTGTWFNRAVMATAYNIGTSSSTVSTGVFPRPCLARICSSGVRMDVNRPFGNGLDDNRNLIVDEHGQNAGGRVVNSNVLVPLAWPFNEAGGYDPVSGGNKYEMTASEVNPVIAFATNLDNDDRLTSDADATRDNDEFLARQIYARHLYVLMMAMKPANFHFNYDGDATNDAKEDAKILAQWAINVVDFRDADAIMTPFEYDEKPFEPHRGPDGSWQTADDCLWCVDGIIGTAAAPGAVTTRIPGAGWCGAASGRSCCSPRRSRSTTVARKTRTRTARPPTLRRSIRRLTSVCVPRRLLCGDLQSLDVHRRTPPGEFGAIYNTGTSAWQWTDGVVLNKKRLERSVRHARVAADCDALRGRRIRTTVIPTAGPPG